MSREIAFWKHHPISDQKGELLANETLEEYLKFKYDIVKLTPAGSWLATCYGVVDDYQNDYLGRRVIVDRAVKSIEDWDLLMSFDKINFPIQLLEQLKAADIVCFEVEEKPVYATVFCPLTQAVQLSGLEFFKESIVNNSDIVLKALELITKNTIQVIQSFVEKGVKGIYFVTQSMQKSQFSESEYKRYGEYFDSKCIKAINDFNVYTIFHIHGEEIYFSIGENLKNVRIHYELSDLNSTLEEVEKIISYEIIPGISAEMMRQNTSKESISALIKSTSNSIVLCGCVLPLDFEDEVIQKWIDTVRNESN